MTKKFVNQIDHTVDDALVGLVSSNTGISFHPECPRVIVRSDYEHHSSKSRVALIAGGGSGHEPYAAGYVGQGLLTAAVCGNVFASPPTRHVELALNITKSEGGAILFVINYTGDRLNFGLAAERFNAHGGNVKVVTIADDVAIDNPSNKVGRRGLAGAPIVIKVAGALAEQGKNIDEIYQVCQKINANMGTLGVSLYPGSIPGSKRSELMGENEIEIGLGIHGEPGKTRGNYESCEKIIDKITQGLFAKRVEDGSEVVLLLNNLGSVSQLEMSIVTSEVLRIAEERKLVVKRLLVGTFMTSLDSHSISLTYLIPDEVILAALDQPTTAPGWSPSRSVRQQRVPSPKDAVTTKNSVKTGASTDAATVRKIVSAVADRMKAEADNLNQLDAYAGDGDCGSTFSSASQGIEKVKESLSYDHPLTLLQELSEIFENSVGGTSGALYAILLSSASSAFITKCSPTTVADAITNANQALQRYGGAKPGDRTMVDSLDAADKALRAYANLSTVELWENVIKEVKKASEETAHMKAKLGRASYTSKESQVYPDAGATAVFYWLESAWKAYNN